MRLMGKRQIGQLQPFEMVITIIIADLAATPMQDEKIPLLRGIIPLIVLLFAQVVFSYIIFRNKRFRNYLNGTPSVIIAHGKINHTTLQSCMINFSDLVEAMHGQGISDLGDIDFAILETNGSISFFQKPQLQCVQKEDINADVSQDRFSYPLIMNGKLLPNYIKFTDTSVESIMESIHSHGRAVKDVIFCYIDSKGKIQTVFKRENKRKQQ